MKKMMWWGYELEAISHIGLIKFAYYRLLNLNASLMNNKFVREFAFMFPQQLNGSAEACNS